MIGSVNLVDIALPLMIFGGVYFCFRRAFLRTLISIVTLFIAFTVAALLYEPLLGTAASNIGSGGATNSGSVVFAGLTLAFFAFFEWMVNRNYGEMRTHALGNADHILGAIVGLVWTALAISLILLILEYGSLTIGASQSVNLAFLIEQSGLANLFRSFFAFPLKIVQLLFPHGLPDILAHYVR